MKNRVSVVLILLAVFWGGVAFAATDPDSQVGGSQDRPCGYKSQFSSMQACLSAQRQCMDKWFWLNCDYSCESSWVPSTLTGLDPKINPLYTIFIDEYSNATYNKEYLLVSKALPIFLAPHYFGACSDLSLLYEAYNFSSQA